MMARDRTLAISDGTGPHRFDNSNQQPAARVAFWRDRIEL